MSAINQKEYLKKYLGIGKNPGDKKKKKKKDKLASKKVHIIDDDDVDVDNFKAIEEDLAAANEDAPQIVAVIDERPPSLRVDEHNNKLWIPLGEPTDAATANSGFSFKLGQKIKTEKTSPRRNDDCSPPRRSVKTEARSRAESPSRRRNQRQVAEDLSPPRHSVKIKLEEDASPPRRRTADPPKKYRSDDDLSPVRQRQQDLSPPRKPTRSDLSPSRKKLKNYDQDGDFSPPRRSQNKARNSPARSTMVDLSPPRKKSKHDMDGDFSPPRRSRKGSTPPQRRQIKTEDASPPRRKRKTSDASLSMSPPRRKQTDQDKMTKTLDGKKAGLQNADALVKETKALKQREDDVFKNMSAEVSGVNAKTIVRNRKPVDPVEEQRKEKLEKAVKEKYSRWGKGLKQVDDQNERMQQELYEMSKPLARYADDEDLEKYLKDQEREGDPMLAYLRKKKKKDAIEAGVPLKPEYMGEFMPNRFGIKPGYRWDGVDRSNGYEKKWFTVQNEKKASIEESYKWSTEDM